MTASTWWGESFESWAGDTVAAMGTVGGPELDLWVGAKGTSSGSGVVYGIVDQLGSPPRSLGLAKLRITWEDEPGAALGASLAALTDRAGDHVGVVIGAPNAYPWDAYDAYDAYDADDAVGSVWILTGSAPGAGQVEVELGSALRNGDHRVEEWLGDGGTHAGHATASGDVNGDGDPDVIVGSLGAGAWVLHGPFDDPRQHSLDYEADVVLSSYVSQAGCSVAVVGDYAGDGRATVAVGMCRSSFDGDTPYTGAVALVDPDGTHSLGFGDALVYGSEAGQRLGVGVQRTGDLDGDGLDDVLITGDTCGFDFGQSTDCASVGGSWYASTRWAVVRGGSVEADQSPRLDEVAALQVVIPEPVNHFSCDGASAGALLGDPDQLDLVIGACIDPQGTVVLLPDVELDGQIIHLPEDQDDDQLLFLPGGEPNALAGAELEIIGDALVVGAWKADGGVGIDVGAAFVIGPEIFR